MSATGCASPSRHDTRTPPRPEQPSSRLVCASALLGILSATVKFRCEKNCAMHSRTDNPCVHRTPPGWFPTEPFTRVAAQEYQHCAPQSVVLGATSIQCHNISPRITALGSTWCLCASAVRYTLLQMHASIGQPAHQNLQRSHPDATLWCSDYLRAILVEYRRLLSPVRVTSTQWPCAR